MDHGKHTVADYWGVKIPDDIEGLMRQAAECAGATPLEFAIHRFNPQGVTAILILAESHITIHTWPEHDYASIDCYTCGNANPEAAVEFIRQQIKAQRGHSRTFPRGEE